MANQPKRHHYIPQFILRNFTDHNGKLYCFDKRLSKTFTSVPTNVFVKNNLNTHKYEDGTTSTHLESSLSKEIESPAAVVVEKIITSARHGDNLELTQSEQKVWINFLYAQLMRHPHQRDFVQNKNHIHQILDDIECNTDHLIPEMRKYFEDPERKKRMANNAWQNAVMPPQEDQGQVMPILKSRSIGTILLTKKSKSFVIGDIPIIRLPSPETSLQAPEVRLLYPVSKDVIIKWGLSDGDEYLLLVSDNSCIRALNEASLRQSNIIAGCSEKLIQSLAYSRHGILKDVSS